MSRVTRHWAEANSRALKRLSAATRVVRVGKEVRSLGRVPHRWFDERFRVVMLGADR
jgi:hypothetical protein